MAPAEGLAPVDVPPVGAVAGSLRVQVVCALGPAQWLRAEVVLPPGATAIQALRASGLAAQMPPGLLDTLTLGLWGRACAPDAPLHDGDRVELTRPLTVDPKEARRLRYRRDGLRPKRKGSRTTPGPSAGNPSGKPSGQPAGEAVGDSQGQASGLTRSPA